MSFIDWKGLFDDIFEAYPDKWTLKNLHRSDTSQYQQLQSKRKMEQTGYARFHCPKCSKNWTSGKAVVMFYFPDYNQRLGEVTLRFFGQQCKRCSRTNDYFVDPEFDTEIIKLFLERLFERVGWFCYGKKRPSKKKTNNDHENKIQGPHEKALCEACRMGCCDRVSTKIKTS